MIGPFATVAVLVAALSGTAGIAIERWLFFAEARHAVTLYYGAEHA
jgi:DMSO reductase anchor subunit